MVVMDPTGQPCFRFIKKSMVGLGIGRAMGLAIGRAVLTGADVAISFSRLSLI